MRKPYKDLSLTKIMSRGLLTGILLLGGWSVPLILRAESEPRGLPEGTRVERDLEYVPGGQERHRLDLYLPPAQGPRPVILWVHGGAWRSGDKENPRGLVPLLKAGFAVASINYRLSQHAIFPAQIQDCKAAVRWLRAHADRYGLDTERFGAWGASAGGHLVALMGTADVRAFEVGHHLDQSSRVQAVCVWFGPTDFSKMDEQAGERGPLRHNDPQSPESRLLGGPVPQHLDRVRQANPITYVTAQTPPMLIMHGDQDFTVPLGQSQLLDQALRAAGVPVTLDIIAGGNHGFSGLATPLEPRVVAFFTQQFLRGVVDRWGRFEAVVVNEKKYADPYRDVRLEVTYTRQDARHIKFWGFHDGGTTWKLRFMPGEVGVWKYDARFSDGTPGIEGEFTCVESETPGPVIADPDNPIWFRHAGGQPALLRSFHVGDRFFAANWDAAQRTAFLDWAQQQGYDTLSIASFFLNRDAEGRGRGWQTPKLWPLDAAEYRKAEAILDDLAQRKIVVFPFAGFFGRSSNMPREPDEQVRYLEYTLARFGPYWNLLLNVGGPEPLLGNNAYLTADDIHRLGTEIRRRDPFGHLLTIHNPTGDDKFKDAEWLSFGTLQGPKTIDLARLAAGLRKNHHEHKPLFAQETLWSGNAPHMRSVGRDFTDDELRRNGYVILFSAAAFNFADNAGDSSSGFSGSLDLNDRRQARHDVIRQVWDTFQTLPYPRTRPRPDLVDRGFCLADEGRDYLVYLPEGEGFSVRTTGGPFRLTWLNTRDQKESHPGGTVADGQNLQPPAAGEWILLLSENNE